MIKRVFRIESDLYNLSLKRVSVGPPPTPTDLRRVVVNKPWGYEYLLYESRTAAVWILFLSPGASTSMHCHAKKRTSLLVLEGAVLTSSLDTQFSLGLLDGLIIDNGVFHSTQAREQGAVLMEIESPPDKGDLIRLKDQYGREGMSYEGQANWSTATDRYSYCDFHDDSPAEEGIIRRVLGNRKLTLHRFREADDLDCHFQSGDRCVISLLDSVIRTSEGQTEVGDIFEAKPADVSKYGLQAQDYFTALVVH